MTRRNPPLALQELAALIERFSGSSDGDHDTIVPGLTLHRWSRLREPSYCIYRPCLAVAAQGTKRAVLADRQYVYDPGHCLVASVELPVASQVMRATPLAPYLGIMFRLDVRRIAESIAAIGTTNLEAAAPGPGMSSAAISPPLLDAVLRLVRLLESPDDVPALAPLIAKEIDYRIVSSDQGVHLRHIAVGGSRTSDVAAAIEWLKEHFAQPLRIPVLARVAKMSVSTLHHHFKSITAMSPLQYQKQLRLQEARRLMLTEGLDAASASQRVGYESPSQFSREYRRLYGAPPFRDIAQLREPARRSQGPRLGRVDALLG